MTILLQSQDFAQTSKIWEGELTNNGHHPDRSLNLVLAAILITLMAVIGSVGLAMVRSLSHVADQLTVTPSDVFDEVADLRAEVQKHGNAQGRVEIANMALSNSPQVIVGLDHSGKITMWSEGAEACFGHERSEVIGYGVAFLIPDGMRSSNRDSFASAMSAMSGEGESFTHSIECEAIHQDGTRLPSKITIYGMPGVRAVAVFTVLGD